MIPVSPAFSWSVSGFVITSYSIHYTKLYEFGGAKVGGEGQGAGALFRHRTVVPGNGGGTG